MGSVARLPKPRVPQSVTEAANASQMDLLVSLRDRVAREIDAGVPPAYLAPLVRQLRDLGKEIAALEAIEAEEDDVSLAAVTPDTPWTV